MAMRLTLPALATVTAALALAAPALAVPGDLDKTFSADGLASGLPLGSGSGVAARDDGSILVVGEGGDGRSFAIRAYEESGQDDLAFSGGYREIAFGDPAHAGSVEIEPAGSILVAGFVGQGGDDGDVGVARLMPGGALDPSLGGDGTVTLDYAGGFDRPMGLDVADDGTIFVGGIVADGTPTLRFGVVRLLADGTPDPAFGGADGDPPGWVTFPVPSLAESSAVAALPGGGAVLASGTAESNPDLIVRRLTPAGVLDPAFGGGDGFVESADLGGSESAGQIDIGAGRIDVGVNSCAIGLHTTCDFKLQRFTLAGDPHPGSPPGGLGGSLPGASIEIDAGGRTVVAGSARAEPREFQFDFAITRVLADGTLDQTFSGGDGAFADFGLTSDRADDLALAPDGRIAVSGAIGATIHGLARFEITDGPPDADADGVLDPDDRCPARYSGHPGGCPRDSRLHKLRARGNRLVGRLTSEIGGCIARKRVQVYREDRGRDTRVARERTNDEGRWKLPARRLRGPVYAVAKRGLVPELSRCARAETKTVRP